MPAIIPKEIWEQAQFLLDQKPKRNVRASSGNTHHRYTGLIKCGDCGSSFSCKTRYWRDNPPRMEYVCNGYHRYGKENCAPNKIGEEVLDRLILKELEELKVMAYKSFGIEINEDIYALSTMLQWMWRSAIRRGEEIWVYVPSRRMRTLLKDWIEGVQNGDNNEDNNEQDFC